VVARMPPQPATAIDELRTRIFKAKEIRELVNEGAKLALALEGLAPMAKRLDEIKDLLRQHAGEIAEVTKLEGDEGAIALLKPVSDSVMRYVSEDLGPRVRTMAGGALDTLFALSPRKDFALNAFKSLSKGTAEKLLRLLTVPSSARVTFSGGALE
jgi:hypothetical protein